MTRPSRIRIALGTGNVDDCLAENLESASEVTTPSVGQKHIILANDVESATEISTPALGQKHGILAEDLESASEVSTPTAGESDTTDDVLADDLESASEVSTPALGQKHIILANDLESASEVSTPTASTIAPFTVQVVVADKAVPTAADIVINDIVESLGYPTVYVGQLDTPDVDGYYGVVICESVSSANINTGYKALAVPVVVLEQGLWDDMDLSTTGGDANDTTQDFDILDEAISSLPASGNPYTGATTGFHHTILISSTGPDAIVIAYEVGSTTETVSFAYEIDGEGVNSYIHPARRVAWDARKEYINALTADGVTHLEDLFKWAFAYGIYAEDIESATEISTPTAGLGTTDDVLAEDLESASELTTPDVGQKHAILAEDLESASEITTPSIGQKHAILAEDLESATEISTPSMTGAHHIEAVSVESATEISTPDVGQKHALLADDLESASEITTPAVGQKHGLLADDLESASELTTPTAVDVPPTVNPVLAESIESATEITTPTVTVIGVDEVAPVDGGAGSGRGGGLEWEDVYKESKRARIKREDDEILQLIKAAVARGIL